MKKRVWHLRRRGAEIGEDEGKVKGFPKPEKPIQEQPKSAVFLACLRFSFF